jgi:hypothetical protein
LANRFDRPAALGKHGIAARAKTTAIMPGDQTVEDFAKFAEGPKRTFFACVHETRIPFEVGGEDHGQLPLYTLTP